MSFNGFSEKTLEYFLNIYLDNTKANFETNRAVYNEHVKAPLRALYESLAPAMLEIDPGICAKASRCVSGAYNDLRYAKSDPIKSYMYLHFCAETGRETDVPGFFMDASFSGWRYGLQLYHRTSAGMTKLRDAASADKKRFSKIIRAVDSGGFALEGEDYRKITSPTNPRPSRHGLTRKAGGSGPSSRPTAFS
jgi:uncharacterized protein (DUF2461 family)